MNRGILEILIGNIASGKSTYADNQAKQGALIVDCDSVVNAVHANNYFQYSNDLSPLYKRIENEILTFGLTHNKKVIVDRVNEKIMSRLRWITIAKSLNCKDIRAILFKWDRPDIHAKRRYTSNSRGYTQSKWLEVAQLRDMLYEPINRYIEPYDKIIECTIVGENYQLREIK